MTQTWKITVPASRDQIEAALLAHEEASDWDPTIVIAGSEVANDRPEDWLLEAWLERKPRQADKQAIASLIPGDVGEMQVERLPQDDWLSLSQQGVAPVRAGRFYLHTPDYPPLDQPRVFNLCLPAGQAFGTGQHESTAGCLAMLTRMRRSGLGVRNCADIGTGTGVLAFAALRLWPRVIMTASDIDPVSTAVVMDNAARNGVAVGARGGELTVTIADGMNHPLIAARGPYDLVTANILAGPLVEMAPAFADALVPGGNLLLAGLLASQEGNVRSAMRRAGFRLAARETRGDWAILWLRKRARAHGARAALPGRARLRRGAA